MSASPVARQATNSQSIPRRVLYNDESQLPCDYSSTPGGTLYSTTPGGTRIVYERQFLMQLRNSPLARTPPKGLSTIPDSVLKNGSPGRKSTSPPKQDILLRVPKENGTIVPSPSKESVPDESLEQFQMEM